MKLGQTLVITIVLFLPISGCLGDIELFENHITCSQAAENGVVVSFDDKMNIISWNESIPFLSEHEIIATFYVDRWDKLTDEEISILHEVENLGH